MSKISLDLSSIKSAGVYFIEIDETQRTEAQVQALRLLVGFSGKGPFNRPVFLQNDLQRQKLFGDIDTKLEKKGCFFNRAARTMLDAGPVLALNLLKVDDSYDGPDQVNYTSLSLDAAKSNPVVNNPGIVFGEPDYLAETVDKQVYDTKTGDVIPFVGKTPYSSLFDRARFWLPSDHHLLQVAAAGLGVGGQGFEKSNFINFANCGTDEISILVYKAEGFTGYDITAKDWYGGEQNIPFGWIRPSDYISDYFIRVVAVKGNWSNYPILSSDSKWGKYFDQKGIIKDKIFQFSQAEGIEFIGSWSGVIIPDFVDKQGNYLYIKDRVNANTESTGLLMSINEDAMEVISYDLNGIDKETGDQTGYGAWIYDYDGNAEADSEAGETEISELGYKIDMVGHGFQKGLKMETQINDLKTMFDTVVFDNSTGTLKDVTKKKVFYVDDSSKIDFGVSYETTVKVQQFFDGTTKVTGITQANGEPLYLYGVYDTSSNRRMDDDGYGYVVLTEAAYDANKDKADNIKKLSLYNAQGKKSDKTVTSAMSSLGIAATTGLKLKNDMKDNTKYVDTSVFFGNYVAWDGSAGLLYTYSIDGDGIQDEGIVRKDQMDTEEILINNTSTNVLSYSVRSAGVKVMFEDKKDTSIFVEEETGEPKTYGINFMSYNYVSDNAEEVITNVRNVYYFNGKYNKNNTGDKVELAAYREKDEEKIYTFNGKNPVNEDNLNMFIVTDEQEAALITVGDLVQNITFNNNQGEATKFGLIPGVTKITNKIFVNITSDNKFSYKGNTYSFNASKIPPIRTRTGKRGFYLFTAIDPVLINNKNRIVRQLSITNSVISKSLRFIPLKGLHISARHRPGYDEKGRIGVEAGINKIYSVLNEQGINRALMDTRRLTFAYIVDSMSFGISNGMSGKNILTTLAMDRGMTTALLNAPSKKQFEVSSDPCFCATYDANAYVKPSFDSMYIPMGGNPDLYNTKQFTLPTEDEGAKFGAAFFPHLVYREAGHDVIVPPAADVSNVFLRKYTGAAGPYDIMANQNGIINNPQVTGVEYNADQYDRDQLEPFGINSIIQENGQVKIYGNQTCYQLTHTDMCKLHVRENLNFLERSLRIVLDFYNFKYNNPQTRAEVVTAITPILEAMKNSRALEAYTIVCDQSNNTREIIEKDILLIDVAVVMNHGMEKIVTRLTLKRSGDLDNV